MRTGSPVPADVELAVRDALRSIERGLGGPALKDSFKLEDIRLPLQMLDEKQKSAIVAVGSWFLLREIEIAALRQKHMQIDREAQTIIMTLWASKTDQIGNLVTRTHRCYCGSVGPCLCPFHVALAFSEGLQVDPEAPLFTDRAGSVLSKSETIESIRSILQWNSVPLVRPGPAGHQQVERFGGNVLRVSGSQFMARRGVPLSTIMLVGQWGSSSIERYVQEAELDSFVLPNKKDVPGSSTQTETVALLQERVQSMADAIEKLQLRPDLVIAKKAHLRDLRRQRRLQPLDPETQRYLWLAPDCLEPLDLVQAETRRYHRLAPDCLEALDLRHGDTVWCKLAGA
ncbi:unnamed protein product [Symbiodinium natans]|uniref:Uncharacterized protein n=1 Tax=Symbiodinium natans TaxID=878477 RepID=A0A812JH04_9DINO|nr:unnamed protein product [Symbiodinium natans]